MSLRKTIRRVLKEEENNDLSKMIKTVVETFLEDNDPDKEFICGYELFTPTFQKKIKYKIFIHFNSGPNSKNWPRTQAVIRREETLGFDIQDYILNYTGEYVEMYSRPSEC
jgi:hypothetical protein